ncbi:MAG: hypothetical protein V1744_05005 [Candidatus Altiarchaeota archaeon]
MDRRQYITLALIVCFMAGSVSAKRVLFYEIGTAKTYAIEGDYSKFAEELKKKGYEVASIEKGEVTKEKLENYDILVVQEINKQLTTSEISAIIWFVLQKGRGLLINGGGQSKANQLTIPFGATVDNGLLIDTSDMIGAAKDRNSFTIDRFTEQAGAGTLRQGISKIGFYKDSGLILSGNGKCIATGNGDTYSDTGSFAAGSEPCVAAASLFGNGLVLTLSDADMLVNKNIDQYNNRNFGLNIIDWLSLSTENVDLENNTQELSLQIKEMKLRSMRLDQQLKQATDEKNDLTNKYAQLSMQYADTNTELTDLKEGMIGPFSRSNWAIIVLGVCLLAAAILYSKRKTTAEVVKDEDILNELGYELDSSQEGGEKKGEKGSDEIKA